MDNRRLSTSSAKKPGVACGAWRGISGDRLRYQCPNHVDPRHQWVGLWATATGYQGGPNLVGDQEFVDLYDVFDPSEAGNSVASGTQVSVHVLSLGSPSLFFQMGSLPLRRG